MSKPVRKNTVPPKESEGELLRQKLKLKSYETKTHFSEKFADAVSQLDNKGVDLSTLRQHSAKILGSGALVSSLMLGAPATGKSFPKPKSVIEKLDTSSLRLKSLSSKEALLSDIKKILPEKPQPISREQEKQLEKSFREILGVNAKATLEGEHLNTTYGRIGAEQHLRRYPGDVNENHAPGKEDYGGDNPQEILKEGMAPGLGAWGYFAPSKSALTEDLVEIEKWYAVVQTLYLPNWGTRQPHLRDWYKHRKVLIVNTDNGQAVVAAIADAGPAAWTGKHFGGSPEVMDYLGGPRYKIGPVVLFFVDDPESQMPLGPVEYNKI